MEISIYLLVASLLIGISVFSSKISERFGIPALLIFLGIGMIAGSDGLNIIFFDDYELAQYLGIIALAYILFSGGLDTDWEKVRPIAVPGALLSTVGVLVSALVVGFIATLILDISIYQGILLGAIISSTDAAAVFSVLRSRDIGFKGRLQELIEFESGTNDPMAILLTIGMIQWITIPETNFLSLLGLFSSQMILGLVFGYLFGKAAIWIINHINLDIDGLYQVLALAFAPLVYAITDLLGGSGFLAAYITGLVMGNSTLVHKHSLMNFFDGIGWLMQIGMFLTLGLLVFPTEIIAVSGTGIIVALILIFLARPISIFATLLFSKFSVSEKLLVSWVGLRGAVPIILATFPLVAGLDQAELFFSIIFFVVVISVVVQGTTIPLVTKWLQLDHEAPAETRYPIYLEPTVDSRTALKEIVLREDDFATGKQIFELQLPKDVLVTLINRNGHIFIPDGTTQLEENDKLLILSDKDNFDQIKELLKVERDIIN